MNYSDISLRTENQIATLQFERPEARNAFTARQRAETMHAISTIKSNPSVRVLVLRGAGEKDFSSGQDLTEPVLPERAAAWMEEWGDLYQAVLALDIPTVAAINGFAAGAGLQVAMLADVRVAAVDAVIVLNEIEKGIPVISGTALLKDLISAALLQDMTLTARPLNGREAKEAGIVSRVFSRDTFDAEVATLAKRLADVSPTAVKLNKEFWRSLRGNSLHEALEVGKAMHPIAFAAWKAQ